MLWQSQMTTSTSDKVTNNTQMSNEKTSKKNAPNNFFNKSSLRTTKRSSMPDNQSKFEIDLVSKT